MKKIKKRTHNYKWITIDRDGTVWLWEDMPTIALDRVQWVNEGQDGLSCVGRIPKIFAFFVWRQGPFYL
jgi:hypothetical protein